MPKKSFKAPFTAPSKFDKDKLLGAPVEASQKGESISNIPKGNVTAKKPAVSLTDAEYEELFNSAINSVMSTGDSQDSSQNFNSNDKVQKGVPESKKANSKFVANTTIKNNSHFCKQHFGKTELMQRHSNHQMQRNNQCDNTTANGAKQSSTRNEVKPKNLFKGVSKQHEQKLMHKTSHCVTNQTPQSPYLKGGQIARVSSNCITTNHLSGSDGDENKENTPPRNKVVHHCKPQSGESHTFSTVSTPTHYHYTPCSGHLQSRYYRENHEMTHTPCKLHANVRTPNTPTKSYSSTVGSYGNDKIEDIPASYHKSTCSHTPCSGHSTGREKSSQKSHTYHSLSQSQPMLSQPPPELSLKERLEWLQKRRDIGLWVQCSYSHCSKWRYLDDVHDPVEVPEKWYCHMNSDKNFNSCSAPEKGPTVYEEEDLIHNLYTAGSLVWGRLDGYPWWPAMVDDDPDTEQYYWLNGFSDIPTHYNVTFFDDKEVTRAWLTPGALKPFTGMETGRQFRRTRLYGVDYGSRIEVAKSMAAEALQLGIGERLRKFSFLSTFKGPFGTLNSKKREKEDYDSDASDDRRSSKKKRFNVMKMKKQTSSTHSSGKLHNREKETKGETKPFSKKAYKKKDTEKTRSQKPHKPQTLISKHVLNKHIEKPINVQETKSVKSDESNSKKADTAYDIEEESLTQCSITHKDADDDYEINSSQDLFLSQEKNNSMTEKHTNNNEGVTNITEVTTDFNSQEKNNPMSEKQTKDNEEVRNITEVITDFSNQRKKNPMSEKQRDDDDDEEVTSTRITEVTTDFNRQRESNPMSDQSDNDEVTSISEIITDINSQGKNNPMSEKQTDDNEEVTNINITEITTNFNSGLKNVSQNSKSPEISQNSNISGKQLKSNRYNFSNYSNREKLPEAEVLDCIVEEAVQNTEAAATAESLVAAEPSDAIVPCSQNQTSQPGDAVVPNIEESFGLIRNDNDDENNHDNHCNASEDSIDFELEE